MTFEDRLELIAGSSTTPETRNLLSMPESIRARLAELEIENLRLQRLVAELLMKNQLLRGSPE